MLRETKIGMLVACSFLGLVGTVFALKYKGDPLAAQMSAASTPDSSVWPDPTPAGPESVVPIPTPAPAPENSVASATPKPDLQPLSNPNELKLVSATGTPKTSAEPANPPTIPPPTPAQHIEERRTTPLTSENSTAVASSEPIGSPVPTDPPASPASAPTPPAAVGPTTPKAETDPLKMPEPEKVIDPQPGPGIRPKHAGAETPSPAVAAVGPGAVPPNPDATPAHPEPSAPPAATLGVPAAQPSGPSPEIKPAPIPIIPHPAVAAATPPPVVSTPAVSPPIHVPTPATSALIVPQVASFDEETYQWRAGDSMKAIATQHYHSDKYEQALLQYNRDYPLASENIRNNPSNLSAGQPIYIPQVKVLENRYPNLIPGLTPLPQSVAAAPAPPPAPPRAYRVSAPTGEMMRDIAGRSLGNAARWMEIYDRNPKYDPAQPVPAGVVLQMPADAKP